MSVTTFPKVCYTNYSYCIYIISCVLICSLYAIDFRIQLISVISLSFEMKVSLLPIWAPPYIAESSLGTNVATFQLCNNIWKKFYLQLTTWYQKYINKETVRNVKHSLRYFLLTEVKGVKAFDIVPKYGFDGASAHTKLWAGQMCYLLYGYYWI